MDEILHKYRSAQDKFLVESFGTIAAYGPNAAMMHYHATEADHAALERKGFLLVDCGGTYMDGTTDITRTYPLGPLTEEERLCYTWTLQSHIDIAKAVWLDYCTGQMLDSIAREPLWQHLINYRCGTGHSVSFVGNVHEGPHSLNPRNQVVFEPGMVITDEPGVYEGRPAGHPHRERAGMPRKDRQPVRPVPLLRAADLGAHRHLPHRARRFDPGPAGLAERLPPPRV